MKSNNIEDYWRVGDWMESHKTMNTESASRDQLAAANSSSACLSRWEAKGNPALNYMHSHTFTWHYKLQVCTGGGRTAEATSNSQHPVEIRAQPLENDSTWLDYKQTQKIHHLPTLWCHQLHGWKTPHLLRWFRWEPPAMRISPYFTPAMFELFHHNSN